MARSANDAAARDAKIAELKRVLKSGPYDSLEELEDAVDAVMWGDEQTPAAVSPAPG